MPIYEYLCPKCNIEFELMRPISQMNDPAPCPKCSASGQRLVSVFASKADYYIKGPAKPALRKPAGKRKS